MSKEESVKDQFRKMLAVGPGGMIVHEDVKPDYAADGMIVSPYNPASAPKGTKSTPENPSGTSSGFCYRPQDITKDIPVVPAPQTNMHLDAAAVKNGLRAKTGQPE